MIHNPIRKALPDLSNPGAAGDLRSGKQLAGADGSIVTGTLPEVTQATPTISVSSGGLITASATQSGGIVAAGSKSATQQLPTQAAKTVTPGTTNQTAVASGRYTTGDVVVAGDANLVPENIAEGVSIFGVTGVHSGGGGDGSGIATTLTVYPPSSGTGKIYYTGLNYEIVSVTLTGSIVPLPQSITSYTGTIIASTYAINGMTPIDGTQYAYAI